MYLISYSSSYVATVLFGLIINFILMIKLRRTNGSYAKDINWDIGFLISGCFCSVTDILCVILSGHVGRIFFYILNAIYFCSLDVLCFILFIFTFEQCFGKKLSRKSLTIMAIPLYLTVLLIITSYWTDIAFNVDSNGVYYRGQFFYLFYFIGNIYSISILGFSIIYILGKQKFETSLMQPISFALPLFLGASLQVFFPTLPFTSMGLTLLFIIIFINRQEYFLKKNATDINQYKNQLARYIDVLLHDCLYFYEFDLTEGIIRKELRTNGDFQVTPEMKVSFPISYDSFNEYRTERFGMHAESYLEASYWTCEGLRKAYESGKRALQIRYESEQLMLYWNATILLMENPTTKHIDAIYICKDVTEIKQNDKKRQIALERALVQAENASQSKSTFLFNMSRDIRYPMNNIIGFTDLAKQSINDTEKVSEYLDKISDSNEILLSIINNVLEMAKIEKGSMPLEDKAYNVEAFANEVTGSFADVMKKKNIKFKSSIKINHNYVYCDPLKLREILANVVSNACKFTPSGGTVTYELDELPYEKKGYVLFRTKISDTGIGISDDFIPHLYDEFAREKISNDSNIEGTGLGLSIAKKLIDLMDGTIDVESTKGKGTTFTLYIPHKIAESEGYLETEETTKIDTIAFDGKKILLAEDNDLNAEIAVTILGAKGFIVDRVADGKDCVEKLKNSVANYYDLILMDIQMPVMNGYDATKAIRALPNKQKARIPVIAMTANVFDEDKQNAFEAGMNDHISKPIDVNAMVRTLAKYLN